MEKLMGKEYDPKFKPDVKINLQPDENIGSDTYVPRGNREAVKDNV